MPGQHHMGQVGQGALVPDRPGEASSRAHRREHFNLQHGSGKCLESPDSALRRGTARDRLRSWLNTLVVLRGSNVSKLLHMC